MGFRDRFYTPTTAKALLSWRILLGLGVGVVMSVAGLPIGVALGAGVAIYAASVAVAIPKGAPVAIIDPFVLSEPWRQLMQQAQGSGRKLRSTDARAMRRNSCSSNVGPQISRNISTPISTAYSRDGAARRIRPRISRSFG